MLIWAGKTSTECVACPLGETTFGKMGATACGCVAGTRRRQGGGVCEPCPPDTYCFPCWDTQLECLNDEVNLFNCFRFSTSPPGSSSILNCTCASGLAKLVRRSSLLNDYYCLRPPPNSVYDPVLQQIVCLPGWNSTWRENQLVACTLCKPGFYFYNSEKCMACPKGTYTAVSDTKDECTPCPPSLTTLATGATNVADCGCPPPLVVASEGGCQSCATTEFYDNGKCSQCPPHSILMATAGCICVPGYQSSAEGCIECPVGTFSAHASDNPCATCPEGSTTALPGAERRSRCGEKAALCLPGYTFVGPGLCRADALLVRTITPI